MAHLQANLEDHSAENAGTALHLTCVVENVVQLDAEYSYSDIEPESLLMPSLFHFIRIDCGPHVTVMKIIFI